MTVSDPPARLISMRWLRFLVPAAALTGCGTLVDLAPIGPADPKAEIKPQLMVVEPALVPAGGLTDLLFPEETPRGIHFVLERQTGETWNLVYHLLSSANGDPPVFIRPGTEGIGIPDVGIGGPGPDRIQIPADVPPGFYRICTGNAGQNFCAEMQVPEP